MPLFRTLKLHSRVPLPGIHVVTPELRLLHLYGLDLCRGKGLDEGLHGGAIVAGSTSTGSSVRVSTLHLP